MAGGQRVLEAGSESREVPGPDAGVYEAVSAEAAGVMMQEFEAEMRATEGVIAEATWQATQQVTRQATWEWEATRQATQQVTRQVMWEVRRQVTWEAIREAMMKVTDYT